MITITLAQLEAGRACICQRARFKARYGASASWPTPEAFEADCVAQAKDWDWGWAVFYLLSPAAKADYVRQCEPLRADFERQCEALKADYVRQRDTLWADYERQRAALFARLYSAQAVHV